MLADVFENGESIRKYCLQNQITIAEAMQRREEHLSERSREEIRAEMYKNLVVMRESVRKGLSERVESVSGLSAGRPCGFSNMENSIRFPEQTLAAQQHQQWPS